MNRSACLRLTDRCATILFSIREEIFDAGDNVGDELRDPILRLVEYVFPHISAFYSALIRCSLPGPSIECTAFS